MMLTNKFFHLFLFLFSANAVFADDLANYYNDDTEFKTTEQILDEYHSRKPTECAAKIYSDALNENANKISSSDSETAVRVWVKQVMLQPDVIKQVLECPEVKSLKKDEMINFTPLAYTFPNDERKLNIYYSTQPRILEQHLILANKRSVSDNSINPPVGESPTDSTIFINTEPAWYAIMVVQHGSLSKFVGPGLNNTVTVKYIVDNIDKLYPHGYFCTSKSSFADDKDSINVAVRETVGLGDDDPNDYYVAGDVDLGWVMYAEMAMDVALTFGTGGLSQVAQYMGKSVNASKAIKGLKTSIKGLLESGKVKDYIKYVNIAVKHTNDIAALTKHSDDYVKLIKEAKAARQAGKMDDAAKLGKEAAAVLQKAKKTHPGIGPKQLMKPDELSKVTDTLRNSAKTASESAETLLKTEKDVKKYKENIDVYKEVINYRNKLSAFKKPATGNIITRTLKTIFASNTGAKTISKAHKVARAGMSSKSAKALDWLIESSLKYGSAFARFKRDTSVLSGVGNLVYDMYDGTSATSKEFSNGVEFNPMGLLFADDLPGQENVVNYGMWLMWEGGSFSPEDDDAAYLQATDFAIKFHHNLTQIQEKHGANCNVDIYVVRPIIRLDTSDPNNTKGDMLYLFMNDIPWTTAAQFGEQVKDIKEWERNQVKLEQEDPSGKYRKKESNAPTEPVNSQNTESTNNESENQNYAE